MAGLNRAQLLGRLGKDPEVRSLNNGDKVVSFSIATSESWKDKNTGERKEKTEWHNIVIFNENLGKLAEQYCKKGSRVFVEGQIQTRKWRDQNGVDRHTTEIVLQRFNSALILADGKSDGNGGEPAGERSGGEWSNHSRGSSFAQSSKKVENLSSQINDDIPF